MTTETIAQEIVTPTQTATALMLRLQQARSKMLDPMDYPGQWTKRQCAMYDTLRARADAYTQDFRQSMAALDASTARLAAWQPVRERLRAAEATLIKQLHADPKSQDLKDALTTLRYGGVMRDGERLFGIPGPLLALLTDRCPHCGHRSVQWEMSLALLDEEIGKVSTQLSSAQVKLTHYFIPNVESLLAIVAPAPVAETTVG